MAHIVHLETGRHPYGDARQVLMLTVGLLAPGVESTLVWPSGSMRQLSMTLAKLLPDGASARAGGSTLRNIFCRSL